VDMDVKIYEYDVVVVGAGLAGLAAARETTAAGKKNSCNYQASPVKKPFWCCTRRDQCSTR